MTDLPYRAPDGYAPVVCMLCGCYIEAVSAILHTVWHDTLRSLLAQHEEDGVHP